MIIFYAQGGLGNQLFQYAAARMVSLRSGQGILVDTSWFDNIPRGSTHRTFHLRDLGLQCKDLNILQSTAALAVRNRYSRFLGFSFGFDVLDDRHLGYLLDQASSFGRCIYLRGYWQSYSLIQKIETTLKREFKRHLSGIGLNQLLGIYDIEANLVCIHVRRGDYVNDSTDKSSNCAPSYYKEALNIVASRIVEPVFVVFSDDVEWAINNLPIAGSVYYPELLLTCNATVSMGLMMQCKHFIISNSTFSWWPAWLASTESSVTICPKPWCVSGVEVSSLHVPGWIHLSAC
jgi:hypothetical protein